MLAAMMLVGVMAIPAAADDSDNFVGFIAEQAEKDRGRYNIIGQTVLALVDEGKLTEGDVEALATAEITAFAPPALVAAIVTMPPALTSMGKVIHAPPLNDWSSDSLCGPLPSSTVTVWRRLSLSQSSA